MFLCPGRDLIACGVSEGAAKDHDQIDKCPDAKATHGQQLGDARTGFADVKAVDTKPAQEKTQEESWENALRWRNIRLGLPFGPPFAPHHMLGR